MQQQFVGDVSALSTQTGDGAGVVLGGQGEDGVGEQGEAPDLIGVVEAAGGGALLGVGQVPPERVQGLALVGLAEDLAPVDRVGQIAGRVDGAPQRPPFLQRDRQRILLRGHRPLPGNEGCGSLPILQGAGHAQRTVPYRTPIFQRLTEIAGSQIVSRADIQMMLSVISWSFRGFLSEGIIRLGEPPLGPDTLEGRTQFRSYLHQLADLLLSEEAHRKRT